MDNGNPYVSSIVSNYGDVDRAKQDLKTINEIQTRQGALMLIHAIAEAAGNSANKFRMSERERGNLMHSLIGDLRNALSERL